MVGFDPARRAAGLEALSREYPLAFEVEPQADLRNVDRLTFVPTLLAGFVFLLAVAALVHALVLGARRHRTDLATLRAIGFTRRDARHSLLWMATAFAGLGLAIGIPVGWIAGRMLWRSIMLGLGLEPVVTAYWAVWIVVPVVTVGVALLAAAVPARRAVSRPAGEVLRTG